MKNVVDVDSSFPVIWVDKDNAFKTHLGSTIQTPQDRVMLKTFIDTDSSLESMSVAVSSSRYEKEGVRRQIIACVITNIRRSHPLSGLYLLRKMKNVFPSNVFNNDFSSFPPIIIYSASTLHNASLIGECKAAETVLVLSNNINEVHRIIIKSGYPSISLNFLFNLLFEQRDILSNIPPEYRALFLKHNN